MKRVVWSCALALAMGSWAGAGTPALINGLSAVVHDSVITMEDLDALNAQVAENLAREYRGKPELFRQKMAEAQRENLDQLIDRKLILHDFKTAYNVPDSVIDKDVDRMIEGEIRSRFRDRMSLIRTLQAQGTTYERFRQLKRERFLVDQLRNVNIKSEILISPYKIENYYQTNREKYRIEDQVKLRMIVLNRPPGSTAGTTNGAVSPPDQAPDPVRQRAEEILRTIKGGAAFNEMATLYSEGSQRVEGGDWGWVEKPVLRKELVDVAFSLKAGEVSEVIETPESFYIMKVEEIRVSSYKPLKEVRAEIEQTLLLAEQNRIEKQWVEKLRKKTFIRVF